MSSPKQPNIVMIIMDDQRADAMRCAGNTVLQTPNLDRLASEGIRFTNAHQMGSMVDAVCVASRAMLHTGRYLWRLGNKGRSIPDNHPLLGETLAKSGYHCHGIGKWHNEYQGFARSFQSGAEIFFGSPCDHWNAHLCHFDPTGRYDLWKPICSNPELTNRTYPVRCDHIYPGRHTSEIFADAAVKFLEKGRPKDHPFFLYVAFTAPHDPRLAPPEWQECYPEQDMPLPKNYLPEHPFDNGELKIRDELLAAFPRSEKEIRHHLSNYYAMMAHADFQIGRILDTLDQQGLSDNTIVIHTADHGLAIGSHGLMGKQNLYEHSTRIPLLMRGPGIPAGQVRQALCYNIDLFPTLCHQAGVTKLSDTNGIDLKPVIQSAQYTIRNHLTFGYKDYQRGILCADGRKMIRYQVKDKMWEQCFDVSSDPFELTERDDLRDVMRSLLEKQLATESTASQLT